METPSAKLVLRLQKEAPFKVTNSTKIKRTRAGRNQLAAGAWSWTLDDYPRSIVQAGSCDTVTACLRAKKLAFDRCSLGDWHIHADEHLTSQLRPRVPGGEISLTLLPTWISLTPMRRPDSKEPACIRLHKSILAAQRLLKKLRKMLDRLTPEETKRLGELMEKEAKSHASHRTN